MQFNLYYIFIILLATILQLGCENSATTTSANDKSVKSNEFISDTSNSYLKSIDTILVEMKVPITKADKVVNIEKMFQERKDNLIKRKKWDGKENKNTRSTWIKNRKNALIKVLTQKQVKIFLSKIRQL